MVIWITDHYLAYNDVEHKREAALQQRLAYVWLNQTMVS